MYCVNLAWTIGQQAPTGWPTASARQALRSAPCQTASIKRKRSAGTTVNQISSAPTIVSRILVGELNRRVRRKPMKPVVFTGAGFSGTSSLRTNTMSLMRQNSCTKAPAEPPPVEAHDRAGDERKQEIDAHGHGENLDRLSGLAQRRAGKYRDQVGVADRNRERGVFRQVEILVGQGRQDDPERLRHHDQAQHR